MKGKKHYVILVCGLGCFFIGVICNLIHKSHHTNNYISIIHSTWYFILMLLSCLCFAIAYSFYKDKAEWLYPFIDKRNLNMTFLTIGSILGIPIVGLIVGLIVDSICNCYIHHEIIDKVDFVAHWSIFLSILSIFIGMKVYMRFIGDKDKHSFKEFIDILSDLFDNANPQSDKIYLLLPTIHIGAAGDNNKSFSKEFKYSIENFLNQNTSGNKLQLGILGYDKDGINNFIEEIKKEYKGIVSNTPVPTVQLDKLKEIKKEKTSRLYVKIQDELIKRMPIFSFHSDWYKGPDDLKSEIYFYLELSLFLQKLEAFAEKNKIVIYKIKEQYFNTWGDNENSDKGLFIFVNETKQKAYCGNIIINSQEHIEFQNLTIKKDTNLCILFKMLFDNFVTSNSQKN